MNDIDRLDGYPWIEVRSPSDISSSTVSIVSSEQLELDLPKTFLEYNSTTGRYEADYAGFDSSGTWTIYYFAKDLETGEISPMVRSTVYRDKSSNNSPGTFNLESPANRSEQNTSLVFDWDVSTDPDGDNVTYNLLIATDSSFSDVVYKKEEITTTATIVDRDVVLEDGSIGLSDTTTYYWKVEAVDSYGKVTESVQSWSFETNNYANSGTGWINGYVYDDTNYETLEGATISADGGEEVDSDENGYYILLVTEGPYTITGSYDGYSSEPISIRVNAGDLQYLNIFISTSKIETGPVPDIKANESDDTVTIGTGDTLSITISLSAGDSLGVDCDWWIAESAPDGWYYFSFSTSWTYAGSSSTELFPTYQGALSDLDTYSVLDTSGLSTGTYTYYFIIDTKMDGILDLDQIYYDSVIVNVQKR